MFTLLLPVLVRQDMRLKQMAEMYARESPGDVRDLLGFSPTDRASLMSLLLSRQDMTLILINP